MHKHIASESPVKYRGLRWMELYQALFFESGEVYQRLSKM